MQAPSPVGVVFVACAFPERSTAEPALRALLESGVAAADIGLGSRGDGDAVVAALASELGVRTDVNGEDPLAGAPGLASSAAGSRGIDVGGVIGGAIGAAAGLVIGLVPGVHVVAVDPQFRVLADALLFFVIGALVGATLGGGLSPQRSSHTAFRIVDEIEHGGLVLVATLDTTTADSAVGLLHDHGGLHVIRIPG